MDWLGNLFKGVSNLFGGGGGAQAAQKSLAMKPAQALPRMGAMQTQMPLAMKGFGDSASRMGAQMLPQAAGAGWMDKMFKGTNPQQMALGMGVNALGQFMAPKTKSPNFNESPNVQALSQFQYDKLPGNAEAAINRNLDIQFEDQMKNLRNVYKNVRPGTDYTTDSAYQRDLANLQRNQTLNRADALAGPQLQYAQADQQRLMELANTDIAQIMMETGMSSQEAEQFKQSFSNIGTSLIDKGMGKDDQWSELLKMFK